MVRINKVSKECGGIEIFIYVLLLLLFKSLCNTAVKKNEKTYKPCLNMGGICRIIKKVHLMQAQNVVVAS